VITFLWSLLFCLAVLPPTYQLLYNEQYDEI